MTAEEGPNILTDVLAGLGVEPEWTVTEPGGAGFVAAELGVWLTERHPPAAPPWLRAEVRVALDVAPGPTTRAFLDARNNKALAGRWAHDPHTGAVVLCADLPASGTLLPFAVEAVAEMVCAAETVAFLSAPQRDLAGRKALTLIDGRRRARAHPLAEHQVRRVYPAGREADVPGSVLCLVQDQLLYSLPGWGFEHDDRETLAGDAHGSLLLLRVARHPLAGWGLMVALTGEHYACSEDDALVYAAALNLDESSPGAGSTAGPGCWTYNGAGLEYRVFLTAALLGAGPDGDPFPAARFAGQCLQAAAARSGPGLPDRGPPLPAGPVAQRPVWPGDDAAAVAARRDPINDGIHTRDASIYLDRLGRGCAITDTSLALWRSHLRAEDGPEVDGFVRWAESTSADRARRSG